MLMEQTFEKINAMKLFGMREALTEQMEIASYGSLSFEERTSMLVDREWTDREERKYNRRLKAARLKIPGASMEDIDYRTSRGLDASLMRSLASCRWVGTHSTVIIVGPTGTGKTYLSCALAHQAIRKGHTALYYRAPRLFQALMMAKADGSWVKLMRKLEKANLLAIDDWGLSHLTDAERRDFLEVIEDRTGSGSTIVASQLPVSAWHELIGEPTVADAVLDRLVHNAHRIELKGKSLRKKMPEDGTGKEET